MLDYVIHAPIPYRHRSAGFRALYILANELTKRGKSVAIKDFGPDYKFLAHINDPCPFTVKSADLYLPSELRGAVHVVPEWVFDPPAAKSVRWILNPQWQTSNSEAFLEFGWLDEGPSRLVVDVIEKEFFYSKIEPGNGLVLYGGKYGSLEGYREVTNVTGDLIITQDWPNTRAELGDLLRAAAGVISYDDFSSINLEATICGTPVLLASRKLPEKMLFNGHLGIITDVDDFEKGTEEAKLTAPWYEGVRQEIAGDVDNFIRRCEEYFG